MHAFAAQTELPRAEVAEAASVPGLTCMTVSALTHVMLTVLPARTVPLAVTSVRPLTVVKVATAPGATARVFPSTEMLNAPPVVCPGTFSPRIATKVRSCKSPTRMFVEGKATGLTAVPGK